MRGNEGKKKVALLKMGFYGGMQRATVVLFGMATTMILAHKAINPSQMGVWSLFLIIAAFVEIMRHGLVKNSLIKYLNSDKESQREILSSSLILNTLITGILCILLYLGEPLIVKYTKAPELSGMLYWYGLALFSLIPFSHFEWIMLATSDFKHLFYSYVVRQAISMMLLIISVYFTENITLNLLVIYYGLGIFGGAVAGYIFKRSMAKFHFSFSVNWLERL
ncbi:MAG TPA: oligosaccharide flippase family protein, partial [Segetibacter sp.]